MRTTMNSIGRRLLVPSLLLVLVLSACGSADANATPTMGVDAIFTAAYQTIQAQEATQLALTPPTSTPSPSPFPTLPPPSPLPTTSFASATPPIGGVGSACDNATYVSDVSIPDGTTIKPGENFTKTWRLYNSGSCAWSTSYKLAFDSGDVMGGAATLLSASVPSGSQTDISVKMTAPLTNGTFKGNWRMQNATGVAFGNVVYVEIKVGGGTPVPTGQAGTYTITGTINGDTSNVTFSFTNATSTPTVVIEGNAYYFNVPSGWSGTVQPIKGNGTGWYFAPKTYSNVTSNKSGENYTAVEITATP
ncbi:MAG TPA: NBR1-Ig-like domain-containing protein [Anaerolineales bacterium]